MATSAKLNEKARKSIATQTAAMMATMAAPSAARKVTGLTESLSTQSSRPAPALAEDFAYVAVSLDAVMNPPKDLTSLLKPSGSWLHLVRRGARADHFAISDDSHVVHSLGRGELPQKIYDAIQRLDEDDDDENDDEACVLTFPALYVHALGIQRKDGPTAMVIAAPDKLKLVKPKDGPEIPLKELLKRLRKPAAAIVKASSANEAVYG